MKRNKLAELQERYFYDPYNFILDCFPWGIEGTLLEKFNPCEWQVNLAQDIAYELSTTDKNVRVAVSSGRGIGKTAFVGLLTLWWLFTRTDADIVITANNEKQLYSTTWKELSRWFNMFRYKSDFTLTGKSLYYKEKSNTWRVEPKTWDENNVDGIRGQHGGDNKQMNIIDEASGMPYPVYDAINGGYSQKGGLFLCISNPSRKGTGWFRDIFMDDSFGHDWIKREIDSRDVEITNKNEIEKNIKKYGINSEYVKIHIKGQQVEITDDRFFHPKVVAEALGRLTKEPKGKEPVVVGIDVGGTGDPTEVAIRKADYVYDMVFRIEDSAIKDDLLKQGQVIADFLRNIDYDYVVVDAIGLGASMKAILKANGIKKIYEYNNRCHFNNALYKNKRAEMYSRFKEWMYTGRLPDDRGLKLELAAIKRVEDSNILQLIGKKEIRKELKGESPNKSDAIALTFLEDFESKGFRKLLTGEEYNDRLRRKRDRRVDNYNPLLNRRR